MNNRYGWFIGIVFAVLISACPGAPGIVTEKYTDGQGYRKNVVKGEILVKFKDNVNEITKTDIHVRHGTRKTAELNLTGRKKCRIERIILPGSLSVNDTVEMYRGMPEVEYAEPNYIRYAFTTPDDTRFSEQWGLSKINAENAWDIVTGSPNVIIAVVDTGGGLYSYGPCRQCHNQRRL